jgi:hypothetical protein
MQPRIPSSRTLRIVAVLLLTGAVMGGARSRPPPPRAKAGEISRPIEAWDWLVATDLGLLSPTPTLFDLPAISRTSVSTPGGLRAFETFNRSKRYAEAVKPFNFLLTCYPDPAYAPAPDPEDGSGWWRRMSETLDGGSAPVVRGALG